MASPQVENGHVKIANEIVDKLQRHRISGQEWQVLWVVIRKTWGWKDQSNGNQKKMDAISLSQFETATGIKRKKCHALLSKLIEKNIITKTVPNKGDSQTITYGFQKDYEKWQLSPIKGTVPNKGDKTVPHKGEYNNNIITNIYSRVVNYLNQKAGKNFKPTTPKTKRLIDARLKEKFTENDFVRVIDNKACEWANNPKMSQYLRPETLFGTKFESYLNDTPKTNGCLPTLGDAYY